MGLLDSNFIDPRPWLYGVNLGVKKKKAQWYLIQCAWVDSGQKECCCDLGLLDLVGETSVSTILRRYLSSRCVTLQVQLSFSLVDKALLECPFVLADLENHLVEVEEKFIQSGYKRKFVDLKLEHAQIKK